MRLAWSDSEIGHLKYLLERYRTDTVYSIAKKASKKITKRSFNAIHHKLRELITKDSVENINEVEAEGKIFKAKAISSYLHIWIPKERVYYPLHHWVWEQHYGDIPTGYHIHHINGNRLDNRIENLQLMLARDHLLLHSKGKPPDSALYFYFLQERGLWKEFLKFREEKLLYLEE